MFSEKLHVFKILIHALACARPISALLHRSSCAVLVLSVLSLVPVCSFAAPPDVRVVVDISGSMKKNDPANLRVPAIKLLSNLLPSNSRAGVWTFGQYVNELVPLDAVTPAWQAKAVAAADQIGSTGLFTNIGLALQRATRDWQGPGNGPRHVILLTDGVVDVSKDARDNQVARDELLQKILPAIQASGAKVHTIALSADADAALLQQIARETDGMAERASTADELNRIFLRLFEQAAPRDALPLTDNGFTVDASVEEITVLVFRREGAEPAALLSPDGARHHAGERPASWRWHSDARYDLITVAKPMPGQWQIQAELDPDNRVLVVSKLGLHVAAVPTLTLAGEKVRLELRLTEDGKPIERREFLQLVKAVVNVQASDYQREVVLTDTGNGQFAADWEVPALDAQFALTLDASAPTFERTRTFHLQAVATPVQASLTVGDDGNATALFTVADKLFKADSLALSLEHEAPDGVRLAVTPTATDKGWQAAVAASVDGPQQLHWRFDALTLAGRPISMQGQPLQWQRGAASAAATETKAETATEPAAEPAAESEPDASTEPTETSAEPAAETSEGDSELPWLWIGIGLNMVLVGIGLAFWWVRRRHKQAAQTIEQALADDEEAAQ